MTTLGGKCLACRSAMAGTLTRRPGGYPATWPHSRQITRPSVTFSRVLVQRLQVSSIRIQSGFLD